MTARHIDPYSKLKLFWGNGYCMMWCTTCNQKVGETIYKSKVSVTFIMTCYDEHLKICGDTGE